MVFSSFAFLSLSRDTPEAGSTWRASSMCPDDGLHEIEVLETHFHMTSPMQ